MQILFHFSRRSSLRLPFGACWFDHLIFFLEPLSHEENGRVKEEKRERQEKQKGHDRLPLVRLHHDDFYHAYGRGKGKWIQCKVISERRLEKHLAKEWKKSSSRSFDSMFWVCTECPFSLFRLFLSCRCVFCCSTSRLIPTLKITLPIPRSLFHGGRGQEIKEEKERGTC